MELIKSKSDFNVEVVEVKDIRQHPNADRLDMVYVYGTVPCAVQKGTFKVGDLAVYIPQDAIVPLSNPAFAFLKKREGQTEARVKAIKLRGVYSEGLLIPVSQANAAYPEFFKVGTNCQEILGIRKYQSPGDLKEMLGANRSKKNKQWGKDPGHMPVYGLDSLKRFPNDIPLGTEVVLTEKIHGCNARYSFKDGKLWVGSHRAMRGATNHRVVEFFSRLWSKVKKFFNRNHFEPAGDIWWEIAEKYNLRDRLEEFPNYVFYGEIYGKDVQKRGGVEFLYDSPNGRDFRVFDIWDSDNKCWLSYLDMIYVCNWVGLKRAPFVKQMLFSGVAELEWFSGGPTLLGNSDKYENHIKEGVVARTDIDSTSGPRVILKLVGDSYKLLGGEE